MSGDKAAKQNKGGLPGRMIGSTSEAQNKLQSSGSWAAGMRLLQAGRSTWALEVLQRIRRPKTNDRTAADVKAEHHEIEMFLHVYLILKGPSANARQKCDSAAK